MSKRPCQANNPETCPYHGVRIAYNKAYNNLVKDDTAQNFDAFVEARTKLDALKENKELEEKLLKEEYLPNTVVMTTLRNGTIEYTLKGELHREDGPAVITYDGTKEWYQHGKLHRVDGPAIERNNGATVWYQHDKLHRVDGPAVEENNGYSAWYQNGKLHRVGGPAREHADGQKEWYQNDKLHRVDGPAVIYSDGREGYWLHGKKQ